MERLYLNSNQLRALPPEIAQLQNLQQLWLSSNQLSALPPEIAQLQNLQQLWLSSNQLSALPPEIAQLQKLYHLRLGDNPLKTPPYEIAIEGIDAIRDYFNALGASPQSVNELKVVLVGEGASGKTSLVKRLFQEDFDPHEKQTHGINIRDWIFTRDSQRTLKARLWDFGGQQIMHATHQFFLSKRSLYLLVIDGRKEEKTEYWLQHIEALGGKSPTLVILNKIDENPGFEVNRRFLKEKYPFIVDFYRISCCTETGIAELKTAIQTAATRVEILETLWPLNWLEVKLVLEQKNQAGVDYIGYDSYLDICRTNQIYSETVQHTLLKFLHDLGVVIHFREALLEETNVINPEWVTEAVYKIVTSKALADKTGILAIEDIGKLLDSTRYPSHKRNYIIALMKKFELCYTLDKQDEILVPDLLPVEQPDFTFDFHDAIRFVLQYEFLPKTIMAKFIVRMHRDIKQKLRWRTGVVLEDQQFRTIAMIKADDEAKKIFIDVNGQQKREYFAAVLYTFRDIHRIFAKMEVAELIRLPDNSEKTVDYQELIELEHRGKKEFSTGKRDYQLSELLGAVRSENPLNEVTLLLKKLSAQLSNQEEFHKKAESLIREYAVQILKKLPKEPNEMSPKELGLDAIAAITEMDLGKILSIFKEVNERIMIER
ncbi:MAG: COR domain-containing protein [Thiotrichaceae bacterium]